MRWHSSTISALNSGVNERRCRGFFPMFSMIGHPSGAEPLMVDVRQSGSGSPWGMAAIPPGPSACEFVSGEPTCPALRGVR